MANQNMPKKTQSWIVTVKCTVIKDVFVEGCSKEEAIKDPWKNSTDERETRMDDWEVKSIQENG